MKIYSKEEVFEATLAYFDGDDLSTNVFVDKYCLKDRDDNYLELTPHDMHVRLAREFARIEEKFGGPNKLGFDTILYWLEKFKFVVPQGSIMYGLGNDFSYNSLSNCTVVGSPQDSISSIMNTGRDMANLFKMRCGVGVDISPLRPEGAGVNNSARTSTGAWSFVKYLSDVVNIIGQKGRRGALMVSLDCSHPDVIKFATSKQDLSISTGANISLKIYDDFMDAVVNDLDYRLHWSNSTDKYENIVKAREVWDLVVKVAAETAEPGLLFWDRHLRYNPSSCYDELRPITTNPCLTGDTKVYTADGRGNVCIKDLAEKGEDVPVFCFDSNEKITIRFMRNPRITGYNETIYKVILDDGSEFRTTGNHKFKLKSGEYKEVKDLKSGDSLRIITKFKASIKDIFGEDSPSQDYAWLNNGFSSNRAEHIYIAEFFNDIEIVPGGGEVVHHKDFNASNNSPENLEVYKKRDHDLLHAERMRGDNNPMRRAVYEWSEEKWDQYRNNMSKAISGPKNGRAIDVTNEEVWEHALEFSSQLGRRFSTKEWKKYAKSRGLPSIFNKGGWRESALGSVLEMSKKAASECGFNNVDLDPRILRSIKKAEDAGLKCIVDENSVRVLKECEYCKKEFTVPLDRREVCFCSSSCSNYAIRWANKSKNKIDIEENHKVVSVKICGKEDVYNGTVDDYHNFFVSCQATKTRAGKEKVCYINSRNCGEQALAAQDVCRLTSCNLKNLVISPFTSDAKIDFNKLKEMYRVATRLGDDLVELELEKVQKIIDKAEKEGDKENYDLWKKFYDKGKKGRRIGTGAHGLADLLSSVCIRYDSEEGIKLVDKVFSTIRDTLYLESIKLAEERGPFELFDWEKEKDNEYILSLPKKIRDKMAKVGRRNVCLLTCAPTGSVSICSQSSSGIEPIFRNSYTRRRKINKDILDLPEDSFISEDGQIFEEFEVYHPLVNEWKSLNKSKKLPSYFVESNDIDPVYRVKMQAAIQKNVDSSISSTINLPKGTDFSVVGDLYLQAWELGLKGVTIYVEGSREGVLVSKDNEGEFRYYNAPERPESLECDIVHTQVESKKWVVFVGLLDGKPYEIFAGLAKYVELPKKYVKGFINKRSYKTKNSEYDLIINKDSEDQLVVKNIVETFENPNHGVLGRLISLSLRHGTKPAYLSEQLLKDTDFDFTTYSKCMGRVLKKYIKNGERPENGKGCQECGGEIVYEEGCVLCRSCGFSKCG